MNYYHNQLLNRYLNSNVLVVMFLQIHVIRIIIDNVPTYIYVVIWNNLGKCAVAGKGAEGEGDPELLQRRFKI